MNTYSKDEHPVLTIEETTIGTTTTTTTTTTTAEMGTLSPTTLDDEPAKEDDKEIGVNYQIVTESLQKKGFKTLSQLQKVEDDSGQEAADEHARQSSSRSRTQSNDEAIADTWSTIENPPAPGVIWYDHDGYSHILPPTLDNDDDNDQGSHSHSHSGEVNDNNTPTTTNTTTTTQSTIVVEGYQPTLQEVQDEHEMKQRIAELEHREQLRCVELNELHRRLEATNGGGSLLGGGGGGSSPNQQRRRQVDASEIGGDYNNDGMIIVPAEDINSKNDDAAASRFCSTLSYTRRVKWIIAAAAATTMMIVAIVVGILLVTNLAGNNTPSGIHSTISNDDDGEKLDVGGGAGDDNDDGEDDGCYYYSCIGVLMKSIISFRSTNTTKARKVLDDVSSPQYEALEFILYEDPFANELINELNIIDKYNRYNNNNTSSPSSSSSPVGANLTIISRPPADDTTVRKKIDWLLERYALATLFYSTGGFNWYNTTGWYAGVDFCKKDTVYGITCHHEEEFFEENNNSSNSSSSNTNNDGNNGVVIMNNILPEINFVSSITLSNNNLNGTIPGEIGLFLTYLTNLSITNNTYLTGTIPTEIRLLTNLKHLDLHGNSFLNGDL